MVDTFQISQMFGQSLTGKEVLLLLLSNSFLAASSKSKWHLLETKDPVEADDGADSDVSSDSSDYSYGSVESQKNHDSRAKDKGRVQKSYEGGWARRAEAMRLFKCA